jgi:hypothetical protein
MTGERVDFEQAAKDAAAPNSQEKDSRERSTIEFPYVPLESGIEVARALYSRCGFGSCEQDELAAEMGQNLSGAFRQKTSAARVFGLVAKDGRSAFVLTDLGKRIVAIDTEKSARVEAFLSVPLYSSIFEKFRGHNLPPAKALEREMETLGVAHKQTDRARQAFERSAQHAGFFDSGKERLVRPRLEDVGAKIEYEEPQTTSTSEHDGGNSNIGRNSGGGGTGGELPPEIDPIIRGLISRLPPAGAKWPKDKRKLWLQILENSFDLVYEDESEF